MSQNEQDYRSEFEQWADERDAARAATGGLLVESTTDDPEAVLAANVMQPLTEREQTVVVSHPVRPSQSSGATEWEHFTVENYGGPYDGAELRKDGARFLKNLEAFREATPGFDVATATAAELPMQESVRRAILKADNGPQIFHFLCLSPGVTTELSRMPPLEAAVAVRQMARDLQMGTVDPQGSYQDWRNEMNRREAVRRRGRNGR